MMRTPIFDQLRADMPDAPICAVCGRITGQHDICMVCWQRDMDDPEERTKWHCADCGEYIEGLSRYRISYKMGGEEYRHESIYLCRECRADRMRSAA